MSKSIKRALFYSAVVVFLVLSYVIILYAQGYKYSFSDNRFFRTGAVYLKTNASADVYLDDRLLGNTSFFNNSYRLEGLLPGRYAIRVQKNDYSTWEKSVNVDEGFVTEFSKILLLPRSDEEIEKLDEELALLLPSTPLTASESRPFTLNKGELSIVSEKDGARTFETLSTGVKGVALSKDKSKLAWWTANEVWMTWIHDADYQPYRKAGDKELITRYAISIKDIAWFRDNDHLVIDTGYFNVLEIDTRGGINIVTY
ncbi:MAG: PEGA domain-containing protein [Candidatus Yanofskybacteria bacterium]|nr:PEGA domain-containing protein [Candidatus Yanofskybacteria bacterium]